MSSDISPSLSKGSIPMAMCKACKGTGKVGGKKCSTCSGTGKMMPKGK